jgi:hypothetical protein
MTQRHRQTIDTMLRAHGQFPEPRNRRARPEFDLEDPSRKRSLWT